MRKIPIWIGVVFVVFALFIVVNLIGQQPVDEQGINEDPILVDKSQVQSAPDFTLSDLEGNTVSLSDYKGKNVYINFWATWCGPCQSEMPDIEKIHQEYQDQDLVVLAVNIAENDNTVKSFVNAHELSFSVLLDSKAKVASIYKVSSIPVSVFVNKEGLIVSKKLGLMTYTQMKAYVEELYK